VKRACLIILLPAFVALGDACRESASPAANPERASEGPRANSPLPSPLPDVVARVNGEPIHAGLLRFLGADRVQEQSIPPEKVPETYRRVLDDLIRRELLFQEAMARNVKVNDAVVETAFDEARAQYPDEASWQGFLARRGTDEAGFRLDVRARYLVEALIKAEQAKAGAASDGAARAYFEAHPEEFTSGERARVRHILVRPESPDTPSTREQAQTRAQALVERLRKGEDFAALAREASDDAHSAQRGGLLGAVGRAHMAKPLAEAVFALAPGQVSDPIDTPTGFEIVRLEERLPEQHYTFDEMRPRLLEALKRRKRQEVVDHLVGELWSKARVEILI
jgi:peptidyl-prolyl cis-trans isomerase C